MTVAPLIGVVVPSLAQGGGVPSVARFIKNTILNSGQFRMKLVSLAMSSRDVNSTSLVKPTTWLRGVTSTVGTWDGQPFTHVGAVLGELEFQRLKPRAVLKEVLDECDLIQVVCGSPAWANAVCGLGKPVAVQCATRAIIERRMRDRELGGLKGLWRKKMTLITDEMDATALRSVDAIQVENPWMLEYAEGMNVKRSIDIRYAPPGVDADVFIPLVSRSLGVEPYILCVGRMNDRRKNIEMLLEAYSRLPEKLISSVALILAGSSAPSDGFWSRVKSLGLIDRVSYIPSPDQKRLIEIYQNSAVFAMSSDEEGLGIALLEAMACGVPVVSTMCGGPEGIISDGADGYLVGLDDAVAMAERLTALLQDESLNRRMGLSARLTVERRYSNEVTGAAFLEMWRRMSSGNVRQAHS